MEQWLDLQTLIWLFPIVFIFHDFEEIIMMEKWMKQNANTIYEKLPKSMANRVIKQFSMSTAQFAVAVVVIFIFVSGSTYMANQYVNQGPLANIYCFTVMLLVFFIHVFTHIGQTIFFRSITPGVVTSVFLVLPYTIAMIGSLLVYDVITWYTLFVSLPFILIILPVVLLAHWLGSKVI